MSCGNPALAIAGLEIASPLARNDMQNTLVLL